MFPTLKFAWLKITFALLLLLSFGGCKSEDPYEEYSKRQRESDDLLIQKYLADNTITNFTKTSTGLYYLPGQPGSGNKAQLGNTVTMHYIGKYLINGQKFDSSYDSGIPLTFKVGDNSVIKGWAEGAALMTKGEKSTLIIPSHLAYGSDVLLFEVTLLDVK
jgi:FKBP-type peptidyl-prolyl cis-trans isomerase